jgi:hypothetical protein
MPSSERPRDEDDASRQDGDLGDLWSWSVDTSRVITERLVEMYRDLGTSAIRLATGDLDGELRRVRMDAERLADLSVEVFDRMVVVARRLAERNGSAADEPGGVSLHVRAGQSASAQVWFHNVSGDDHPAPTLSCTPLTAPDGSRIPETEVVVGLPAEPIAAWNSRGALVTVHAPGSARGVFRGWLLSEADPESAIAIRVEVTEPAPSAGGMPAGR